ncbi:DUF2147 domain-containing protein [Methylocystis sp. ATCC 49242]|uniref:DUF2147 domain-containing protein n=1 Tax=Methylocystis sp. ATCC 49242 TaxID=622637 RepID=UPI0001F87A83|nr:DUF2147 domain-containing protein [Methylocystis sp. ATCC 49242]
MRKCLTVGALATLVASALILLSAPARSEGIVGNWARGDGNARVRIAPCGGALCAINTWIRDPSSGEHVGDRLVMKVSGAGSSMSGTAYDPQRKLNYSLEIDYGPEAMQTRGCVLAGIICKSISWTRLSR